MEIDLSTLGTIFKYLMEFIIIPIAIVGVRSIRDMSTSVQELNTQVAVLISKYDNHEKRIDNLEDKL